MKTLQVGITALALMGMLNAGPVMAMATEDVGNGFTPEETCEGRAEALQEQREKKAAIHEELNARGVKLREEAAELVATAREKQVDEDAITMVEKVVEQARRNGQTVDNAYKIMDAMWAQAIVDACDMTAQEFAKAVNYMNPVAQNFEKIGLAAGKYLTDVVDPAMKELNDLVLTAR